MSNDISEQYLVYLKNNKVPLERVMLKTSHCIPTNEGS